ncbi:hypothetical protein KAM486_29920 [Aeromonas caviae]|nr:hypothetical protein KAM486_29920 [Aeromonas caviae]
MGAVYDYPKPAERQARGEGTFTEFDIAALGIIDAPDFTHVRRVGWDLLLRQQLLQQGIYLLLMYRIFSYNQLK